MTKKFLRATICAMILLAGVDAAGQQKKSATPLPLVESAKSFVVMLTKENYAGAAKNFDKQLKSEMPPAKLREVWQALTKHVGPFKRQLGVSAGKARDGDSSYDVVIIKCEFERAPINARLVFDKNKQITGMFFIPAKTQ